MVRSRDIIGNPVVTRVTGNKVGEVDDLVFDRIANRVTGLVLEKGGVFGSAKVVPIEEVISIGQDAVVIGSEANIRQLDKSERQKMTMTSDIAGLRIVTEDGRDLGKVEEVYFDPETGSVSELALAGGWSIDSRKPADTISAGDILTTGDNTVMVKNATSPGPGRDKQVIDRIRDEVQEFAGKVQDELEDLSKSRPVTRIREETDDLMDGARDRIGRTEERPMTTDVVDALKKQWQDAREAIEEKIQDVRRGISDSAEEYRKQRGE